MTRIIIVGAGEQGRMMHNFFSNNTDYIVEGFAVERKYNTNGNLVNGLQVVDFEDIISVFPPEKYKLFIAVTFANMNKNRERLYQMAKEMKYSFATYIDPSSHVDKTATIGENVAIFENNVVQYNASIGNNVVVHAGGIISHSSIIDDNVWCSPGVAIAGMTKIGHNCFLGINSTITDHLDIAPDTIIGAGSVVNRSIEKSGVYAGNPSRLIDQDTSIYLNK